MPPGSATHTAQIAPQARIGAQLSLHLPPKLKLNLSKLSNRFSNSINPLEHQLSSRAGDLLKKLGNNSTITQLDIQAFEKLFVKFSHRPNHDPQVVQVKDLLDSILVDLKASVNLPDVTQEATAQVAIQAEGVTPALVATQEAAVRGQVLDSQNMNMNLELSLDLVVKAAKDQNVPLEDLIGTLAVESNSKVSSPTMSIFGSLAVSLAIDQMVESVSEQVSAKPQITPQGLQNAIHSTRSAMAKVLGQTNTIIEAKISKTKVPEKTPAGYSAAKQIPAQPKQKTINTVSFKAASISKESNVVKTSAKLISSRLWEMKPLLTKIVAIAIKQNPGDKAAIAKFIGAVLNEMDTDAAESVARDLVAALDIETAIQILPHAPAAMLPVLINQHSEVQTTNVPIKEAIEKAVQEFARSEAGQTQVLQAFAEGNQEVLTSNQAGKQAIVQTVQTMLDNTNNNSDTAKLNLNELSENEQLAQIGKLVVESNYARLSSSNLTVDTAGAILDFAAQAQKALRLISTNEPHPDHAYETARDLITGASKLGLTIPTPLLTVIGSYLAASAGITGVKESANNTQALPTPQAYEVPQESARATSIQARVNALETQVGKALPEVTSGQMISTTASAIAAELMVYGMVMKRVDCDIRRSLEIIQALKKKGLLEMLVGAIEAVKDKKERKKKAQKYNADDVDDFINDVATAVRLYEEGELSEKSIIALINRIIDSNRIDLTKHTQDILPVAA